MSLPGGLSDLTHRGVRLECGDARVIAVAADGAPAIVSAERARGHVVTSAFPVELLLATIPDAHGTADRAWGLYAGLADLAGARDDAGVDHPDLTTGMLRGARGGTFVVTNHSGTPVRTPLRLPPGAHDAGPRLARRALAMGGRRRQSRTLRRPRPDVGHLRQISGQSPVASEEE